MNKRLLFLYSGGGGIIRNGLRCLLDYPTNANMTKAYSNLTATGSGTSGTTSITASGTITNLIQAGEKLRIGGTDIYTVATASGTAITTVETLTATYNAGSAMALERISQWSDSSGYNNHATQATASKRPVYNPNQLNGKAVTTWDGANTLMLPSGLYSIANGDNTIFMITKRNSEAGTNIYLMQMTEAAALRQYLRFSLTAGQATYVNRQSDANQVTVTGLTNTNYQILRMQLSGTTQAIASNNGTAVTNTSGQYESGIDLAAIGSNAASSGNFLIGGIAKFLIYNRALSASEIAYNNKVLASETAITIA